MHLLYDRIRIFSISPTSSTCPSSIPEEIVHPEVRTGDDQNRFVDAINPYLLRDGFELLPVDQTSGYPIYRVAKKDGVSGHYKNLIFAANGPKPELVLADALNNDIHIVKNQELMEKNARDSRAVLEPAHEEKLMSTGLPQREKRLASVDLWRAGPAGSSVRYRQARPPEPRRRSWKVGWCAYSRSLQ